MHFLLPLGIVDNVKFGISSVLKYPSCFSPQDDNLIYDIVEIF